MGAKVSKAKRPKRRWIGITFPATIQSRDDLQSALKECELSTLEIRLYDFHEAQSDGARYACHHSQIEKDVGFAIICVPLSYYEAARAFFSSESNTLFSSISSSGKIRLVRERMGLLKPPRT